MQLPVAAVKHWWIREGLCLCNPTQGHQYQADENTARCFLRLSSFGAAKPDVHVLAD